MNRWAANNPELYEQLGHEGYVDYFREAADLERTRQKEEGLYACVVCAENVPRFGTTCDRCKRNLEEDRLERESNR